MRQLLLTATVATFCVALTAPAWAQWPPFPTPGVPRTAGGAPDLSAPAPRTAAGHPDLSGIWERPPADRIPASTPDSPPLATFADVSANMPDGLPLRPWARELKEARIADGMRGNPNGHCLPMGHMQFHLHTQPRKIIQTPDLIVILYEGSGGVRQIFMDGRPLPGADVLPWWYGYSVGRWEDDTLVVETVGLRDEGWLDINGSPLTDEARLIERFQRLDFGTMQIDITVDDPKAYTEPFTVRVHHQLMPDTELIEFICLENEQSVQRFGL